MSAIFARTESNIRIAARLSSHPHLNKAGQVHTPQSLRDYFLVGQNAAGRWVVRDNKKQKGGIFSSQSAAIRFARRESPSGQFAMIYMPEGLEFEFH